MNFKFKNKKAFLIKKAFFVLSKETGGGGDKLVEQGLTVSENFGASFFTPRIDINTVRLLSSQGMSRNAISKHLGCARATVSKALQQLET